MARSSAQEFVPKDIDDLIEFFETHDTGNLWDKMPEADFEIDIKRKTHLIAIDEEVANRISAIARKKKTSPKSLVNSWLKEKVRKAS
jgi:hypothetical protein